MTQKKEFRYIAIAGNIGVGKTTLTKMLAEYYQWTPQFETSDTNPYLNDFYEDMVKWSFHAQIHFLIQRMKQYNEMQKNKIDVIQDRTVYEDYHIFARLLKDSFLLTERDFKTYESLVRPFIESIVAPDLLIYLKASVPTLVERIEKRGREYEQNIRLDYLKKLNVFYEDWIAQYTYSKLLIIDMDGNHFSENKADFKKIVHFINPHLEL